MIHIYTSATPNGWKATVTLEELEIPYKVHAIDLSEGEQHTEEFLKMNPNGRIPVLHDDETETTVFESGALMLYLAKKYEKLVPKEERDYWQCLQWLMFQMGGIGPMQGQAVVFERYFSKDVPEAKLRYKNETRRLYEVLDKRLSTVDFLAGDYSIADIANWCWVKTHRWARVSVEGLENLQRWIGTIAERPQVVRGIAIPPPAGTASKQVRMGSAITSK